MIQVLLFGKPWIHDSLFHWLKRNDGSVIRSSGRFYPYTPASRVSSFRLLDTDI